MRLAFWFVGICVCVVRCDIEIYFHDKQRWKFHEETLVAFGFDGCKYQPTGVVYEQLYYLNISSGLFLETMLALRQQYLQGQNIAIRHGFFRQQPNPTLQRTSNSQGDVLFVDLIDYFLKANNLQSSIAGSNVEESETMMKKADPVGYGSLSIITTNTALPRGSIDQTINAGDASLMNQFVNADSNFEVNALLYNSSNITNHAGQNKSRLFIAGTGMVPETVFGLLIYRRVIQLVLHEYLNYNPNEIIGSGSYSYVHSAMIVNNYQQVFFENVQFTAFNGFYCIYKAYKPHHHDSTIKLLPGVSVTVPDFDEIVYHSWVSDHPNILSLYGAVLNNQNIKILTGLLLEVGQLNNLQVFIQTYPGPTLLFSLHFVQQLQQIANALNYIHQEKLLHRDVKMLNIMVTNNSNLYGVDSYQLKLGDFSLACPQGRCSKVLLANNIRLLLWYPPELLGYSDELTSRFCNQQTSVDWYMYGTLLRDVASELGIKIGRLDPYYALMPLAQALHFPVVAKYRVKYEAVIMYFGMLCSHYTFDLSPLVVVTYTELAPPTQLRPVTSGRYRFRWGEDEGKGPLFNYSIIGNLYMTFIVAPMDSRLTLTLRHGSGNATKIVVDVFPPIVIQFANTFPLPISSSFTMYTVKRFQSGEVALLDANFRQSICFCATLCLFTRQRGANCKYEVAPYDVIEAIRQVDTLSCVEILN